MAADLILKALDEVRSDDMKRFQFYLNMKMMDGYHPISRQRIEGQPRDGIVAVMVDQYGDDGAVVVTSAILEKMGYNHVMRQLRTSWAETGS